MIKLLTILATLVWTSAGVALEFNFDQQPGMPQEAVDGFNRAGALWETLLTDDITVNVEIGFEQLSPGVLGSTRSNRITASYADFVMALNSQPQSASDAAAIQSLQAAPAFQLLINRTADNPNGAGSPQVYLDDDASANNSTVRLTRANAKALGLLDATAGGFDATIIFSSEFNWDFEPDDGIDANHFNFVYVAAHEIGHMLGFTSGVDILDGNSPPDRGPFNSDAFVFVSPADIFRFSTESAAETGGAIDWAADNRPKFFAIDGGATGLGEFSRGRTFGDGQQASHWRDNQGLGLMDPTVAPGEVSQITALDIRFFDVIGHETAGTGTAEGTRADLRVVASSGFTVTYDVVVANDGPDDANGTTVANMVPGLFADVTWTCVAAGGATCASPSGQGQIGAIVDLPAGSSIVFTVSAAIAGAENVASVAPPSGVVDPDPTNNSNTPGR